MFVLDSHCDTPSQVLRLRDLSLDNDHAHVDFPKLSKGGVDGAFFAIYIPAALDEEEASTYAESLFLSLDRELCANRDKAALTVTPEQALKNKAEGKFSVFLGLENGSPIGESLARLRYYYDKGIRYMTLCHSANNQICDSCAPSQKKWNGLSPFGREVIAEMNRIGMMIDVSHISDEAFYDVIRFSTKPVVATHSCCRALADHPRNMTDEMIRTLADNGGVIQINFYPFFLDDGFRSIYQESGLSSKEYIETEFIKDPSDDLKRQRWYEVIDELQALKRPSYKRIVDHIDHVVSLVGIDYVGLGSDFDGIEVTPEGMDDISGFGLVFEEMRRRGYSESDIEKVAGLNFFRVFEQVQV